MADPFDFDPDDTGVAIYPKTEEVMQLVREYGGDRWSEALNASMYAICAEAGDIENAAATFVEIEALVTELERALVTVTNKLEALASNEVPDGQE